MGLEEIISNLDHSKFILELPDGIESGFYLNFIRVENFDSLFLVLAPIKQEYYSKFRLLIMRLIYSLKLGVYPGSIFPLV